LRRNAMDGTAVLRQIEGSEAAHWWAAVLVTPYVLFVAVRGRWGVVAGFVPHTALALDTYSLETIVTTRGPNGRSVASLFRLARCDPSRENLDTLRRPRAIARHGAV
jgi:hypothetical protein